MAKKALGKGIDALLGESTAIANAGSGGVLTVPVGRVKPNPEQPRKTIPEDSLKDLANSISDRGIIQPIVVDTVGDDYIIVAGERRYRAACLAGLDEVPVIIKSVAEEDRMIVALVENIQREDLNPIEEAEAFNQIIRDTKISQEELAKRIGKNRSTIANAIRLLKLPLKMRQALIDGSITSGHARAILSIKDGNARSNLFDRIIDQGLSVRDAEFDATGKSGAATPAKKEKPLPKKKAVELAQMEERLLDILGTKVSVNGGEEKGKIEIHYFSKEDLMRLYDLLIGDETD